VLRLVVAVTVTGGLAALVVLAVPLQRTAAALRSVEPFWIAPMLAAYALTFVARAARFRALGVPLSLPALIGVSSIHQFMNRILPLRTGELAFPVLVRRLCGTSLVEGITLVALCHMLDLASIALSFLVALLAVPQARAAFGPVGTALIAASLPMLLVGYVLLPSLGARLARRLATHVETRRPPWSARLARAAETLDGVRHVKRGAFLGAAVWTMLQWLATFGVFWAAVAAVGLPLGPAEVIVGSTASVLAAVLPIGGIGSFGTLEGGWAAGFVLLGVAGGPAVASGLVMSGATFVLSGIMAAIAWGALGRRRGPSADPAEPLPGD
jgi:uncharacterized membrane protein YbhN (UPF0104 family)